MYESKAEDVTLDAKSFFWCGLEIGLERVDGLQIMASVKQNKARSYSGAIIYATNECTWSFFFGTPDLALAASTPVVSAGLMGCGSYSRMES